MLKSFAFDLHGGWSKLARVSAKWLIMARWLIPRVRIGFYRRANE